MRTSPRRKVTIPNPNAHPQFGIVWRLEIENKNSKSPVNRNPRAKSMDRAAKDAIGVMPVYIPIQIRIIPPIKGRYQYCITERSGLDSDIINVF